MRAFSSDTVVVGVGNTILSDDGAGVHAARLLQRDPRVPAGVTILDGGTLGLELLPYVSDASRVLFLDAVDLGEEPGTRARMTGDDLLAISGGFSAHQLGVADLVAALALASALIAAKCARPAVICPAFISISASARRASSSIPW